MLIIRLLLTASRAFLRSRSQLALENLALRHQLAVLKRSVPRPRITDNDRRLWIVLRSFLDAWRDALILVQPGTVVRWHRAGFRAYWRRKSVSRRIGRPPIPMRLVHLIKRLSKENATWGAPHIKDELALMGHDVAESTVAKYMVKSRPGSTQGWKTFIRNHIHETAACDFFTVPTVRFRVLYVFVVYAERVIGTLRRECTDHIIPWGEEHLRRVLGEYVRYYNEARTHQGLDGDSPEGLVVEHVGSVMGEPVLGGLHHRYRRAS